MEIQKIKNQKCIVFNVNNSLAKYLKTYEESCQCLAANKFDESLYLAGHAVAYAVIYKILGGDMQYLDDKKKMIYQKYKV